jgi:hypothetical protein
MNRIAYTNTLAAFLFSASGACAAQLGLTPYSPERCKSIATVVSAMIDKRFLQAQAGLGAQLTRFIGPQKTCSGGDSISVGKADNDKFAQLRITVVAYELCRDEPTQKACAPGGSARAMLEPLGLERK